MGGSLIRKGIKEMKSCQHLQAVASHSCQNGTMPLVVAPWHATQVYVCHNMRRTLSKFVKSTDPCPVRPYLTYSKAIPVSKNGASWERDTSRRRCAPLCHMYSITYKWSARQRCPSGIGRGRRESSQEG